MRSGYLITRVFHAIKLVAQMQYCRRRCRRLQLMNNFQLTIYSNSNMDSALSLFIPNHIQIQHEEKYLCFLPRRRRCCRNDFFA